MNLGIIKARIYLENPTQRETKAIEVNCLVDTGVLHLCMPEHIAVQLGYDLVCPAQTKEVTTADGKRHLCPYVGPVRISFKNRAGFVGAVVFGEEVLLGAIPMEDLDLVVVPSRLTIDVNPNYPNIPSSPVKFF